MADNIEDFGDRHHEETECAPLNRGMDTLLSTQVSTYTLEVSAQTTSTSDTVS